MNAIRIRVEHYNTTTGMILSSQIIDDKEVKKPVDMIDLGYRHKEQINILLLLQDFKLNHQTDLLNSSDVKCPKCACKTYKYGIRKSKLHAVLTDHEVSIQRIRCTCGWVSESTVEGIYGSSVHPELLEKQLKQSAEHSYRKAQTSLNAESVEKRAINNTERLRRTVAMGARVIENEKLADITEVKEGEAAKELVVVIDGGHIKSNIKDSRSFEAMVGSVFKPENLVFVDKHHNEIIQKTSVASALSDDQKTIKQLVLNACKKEGMNSKVTKLICLTDGANNCWSITKTLKSHCKESEQILDWFHITKRFTVIRNSISEELKNSLDEVKWCLWHGNHQKALLKIDQLIEISGTDKLTNLLKELSEYLERNKMYLVNYQKKDSDYLPYTSTYAEVSVNSIINIRQKCNQKMQWGRQGAHDILQLRTSIFSKTWEKDMNVVKTGIYKQAA